MPSLVIDPLGVYPVEDLSEALKVPPGAIERAGRDGKLNIVRIGRGKFVAGAELLKFLNREPRCRPDTVIVTARA